MLKTTILITFLSVCSGFSFSSRAAVRTAAGVTTCLSMQQGCGNSEPQQDHIRRNILSNIVTAPVLSALLTISNPVNAEGKGRSLCLEVLVG